MPDWQKLEDKVDKLTEVVRSLDQHLRGNGSGKGILDRIDCLEKWQAKFWLKVSGVVIATVTLFEGVAALGAHLGLW